ncbi:MucB/RseB C-terminal domain-containing protein [Chitinilyticum aquatile]|uniref:MucB/RseB C-terminal domain-containing protein n=1 Tax=Chitinilyticum aquatile TaxID=362520 RepID=UPI00048AB670|nr:MucB/RseB C-terminal domain-containing protein [Chitinilyticum aquatile]
MMIRNPLYLLGVQLLLATSLHAADFLSPAEATRLIERANQAAQQTSYQGVFMHQHDDMVESFRIIQLVEGGSEQERCESLDGPTREYVRTGAQYHMFHEDTPLNLVLDRAATSRFFPRLTHRVGDVLASYQLRKLGRDRVAGLEADVYQLEPRDGLRYPHRLWINEASGLLLKSMMLGAQREPVETYTFVQLRLGGGFDKKLLKPVNPVHPVLLDSSVGKPLQGGLESQWQIRDLPPGFVLQKQIVRTPQGDKGRKVQHLVYSDGLVTVSVFLDPSVVQLAPGLARQGSLHFFVRPLPRQTVTVLGEVPAETVKAFAAAFTPR